MGFFMAGRLPTRISADVAPQQRPAALLARLMLCQTRCLPVQGAPPCARAAPRRTLRPMTSTPPETLSDLRVDIDRIDAAMHELLIERGTIIDRLIAVKARAGGGSAFRPGARGRHDAPHRRAPSRPAAARYRRGHLAHHHLDLHLCAGRLCGACRRVRRATPRCGTRRASISASRCRCVPHAGRRGGDRGGRGGDRRSRPRCGSMRGASAGPWWRRLGRTGAPKIIARLPFVERPDHPAGMPVFVVALPSAASAAREIVVYARLGGSLARGPAPGHPGARGRDPGTDRRRLRPRRCWSRSGRGRTRGTIRREPGRGVRATSASPNWAAMRPATISPPRCRPLPPSRRTEQLKHPEFPPMSAPLPVRPVPRPGILDIEAYVPGKSAAAPGVKTYKLSANETPLGPSPKAVEAFRAAAGRLDLYPDGSAARLREAIAHRYGLDPARIVCGCGSDDILTLLAYAFIGAGRRGHRHDARLSGLARSPSRPRAARRSRPQEVDLTANVDAILAAWSARTPGPCSWPIPNNPTGTYLPFAEIKRLHAGAAAERAAGARRRLCRICAAQRLFLRPGARRHGRERRDDPDLLQDLRPRGAAHRLVLWRRRRSATP